MYKSSGKPLEGRIIILPPHTLNSDPPAMTRQNNGSKVLHLMGEHTAYRKKVFSHGFSQLCEYSNPRLVDGGGQDTKVFPHQLGMTQNNLLNWTLEVIYLI